MCTPTSWSRAPYSSHSRSLSPSPCTLRVWSNRFSASRATCCACSGPVAAPLAELDDAAAADVGIALDLADARAVAPDVVEHQPFAQRQVAERELVRAEPADDGVEQHRRRRPTDRRGADPCPAAAAARRCPPRRSACAAGAAPWPAPRRLRISSGAPPASADGHRAEAEDRSRRADQPLEAAPGQLIEVGCPSRGRRTSPAAARPGAPAGRCARSARSAGSLRP